MNSPGPFRSEAVTRHARGQGCTLRFPGICDGGGETTVFAHIRDVHKGFGIKASDHSGCFACAACHREMDEFPHHFTPVGLLAFQLRALQETWAVLIADGIIGFPHDPEPVRTIKPRKPPEQRKPIPRSSRPIQSRPFPKRKAST